MRATLKQAKDYRIPSVLGICSSSARFTEYLNEAQERLLTRGLWWGTYQRLVICVNNGCLVWPRQVAAIEAIGICAQPIPVRNEWWEFNGNGLGIYQRSSGCEGDSDGNCLDGCGPGSLLDRGITVAFDDLRGTNKKLKAYGRVVEDDGKKIRFIGYDENNKWIRSKEGSVYVDGEQVTLSTSGVITTNKFTVLSRVIKDVTEDVVNVYELNTLNNAERLIGTYEWDEEVPSYRRSLLPGLEDVASCSGSDDDCAKTTVTVLSKVRFISAKKDTDFLVIGNLPALKDMCQALKKREMDKFDEAEKYEASAIRELQNELDHYLGTSAAAQPTIMGAGVTWAGPVENLI